ncbi:MAG: UDP-N-acetylmuramoyl-L-alanine--D-glutamate ligase, partial [Candidatus Omnitrophica bacterium]|nr:UDP-N-acetylmuramoyl-L-alanine--D-glutamate ligase [Candidatus Omnitrophota bacterium]
MKNPGYFKGKKVTVVGLARSGEAASLLLKDLGAEVCITDAKDNEALRKTADTLKARGIKEIELGKHTQRLIQGQDLVVISPGVSDKSPAIIWADELKIPVISEI